MENIRIDVGVDTPLTIDLTNFDFSNVSKVILTIKNEASPNSEPIIEKEFETAEEHNIIITNEESLKLHGEPVYDFIELSADGNVYKSTENGKVILRQGVGQDEQDNSKE